MGHINDSRGSQWLPRCISGGSKPTGGGAGALTPSPMLPAAAMPPRGGGTGRERYLQNPWRGMIPVAGRMHLGVTHGGRKGRGQGIGPFTDVSRCRHAALRRGNRQGKVFAKSMERRDPSGLANASWGHTRGPQGAGAGHWPLNLGFPPPQRRSANKVIGGRPPSHGAGGHLMHGARGAEKGGEGQDESRREQEGEPQLPFPLADAGVRRLCTQARPSPGPSGWTGPNPAG